jgi:hypothetical protein
MDPSSDDCLAKANECDALARAARTGSSRRLFETLGAGLRTLCVDAGGNARAIEALIQGMTLAKQLTPPSPP